MHHADWGTLEGLADMLVGRKVFGKHMERVPYCTVYKYRGAMTNKGSCAFSWEFVLMQRCLDPEWTYAACVAVAVL